jgi:acyl-CoA thioester hydrolase
MHCAAARLHRMPTWSAPVRYAEVDQQGIVFNSHYLLYCDEAMGAFCLERGLGDLADRSHLVASSLTWSAPARWGDVVDVDATCTRLGTTSFVMHFDVRAGDRAVCAVDTTYVLADDGRAAPLPDDARAALTAARQPPPPG